MWTPSGSASSCCSTGWSASCSSSCSDDNRSLLLLFPNTFEYYFIFYEAVRCLWDPATRTRRFWLWSAGLIWVFIKLPQEYWIHVAQIDTTDLIADKPWVGVLMAVAVVALLAVFWFVVRPRLDPTDHPLPAPRRAAAGRAGQPRSACRRAGGWADLRRRAAGEVRPGNPHFVDLCADSSRCAHLGDRAHLRDRHRGRHQHRRRAVRRPTRLGAALGCRRVLRARRPQQPAGPGRPSCCSAATSGVCRPCSSSCS